MKISIAAAMAMLLIYGAYLQFGPKSSRLKIQSQWQENRYVLEKYFRNTGIADLVFVGSSLTKRLDLRELSPCAYNMALSGESILTGLNAVAKARHKPKKVFVEINVPQRGNNQDLIDHASGVLQRLFPIFYTENIPTNFVYSVLSGLRDERPFVEEFNASIHDMELFRHQQSYKIPLNSALLDKNKVEYQKVIGYLESQGVDVVLFEMPVHPSLETSIRAVQIRSAFRDTFPNNQFIGYEDLSGGARIRTVDGIHLSSDDAKAVVFNLGRHFRKTCPNQRNSSL